MSFIDAYLGRWLQLQATPGLFRNPHYALNQRRQLDGELGVCAQYNVHHLANKRPTGMTTPLARLTRRAFDAQIFNFTRANPAELVCTLRTSGSECSTGALDLTSSPPSPDDVDAHPVFVNPSPLLRGHSLLVPRMRACLAQEASHDTLLIALRFLEAAQCPSLRLGFNSLGGWASVNHMHFHVLHATDVWPVSDGRLPIEQRPLRELHSAGVCRVHELAADQWPLPALVFSLAADGDCSSSASDQSQQLSALAACCAALTDHLLAIDQPHQLVIAPRAIYVVPRAPQDASGGMPRCAVALAEICGLAIVYSQADIDGAFGEAEYATLMREARVDEAAWATMRTVAVEAATAARAATAATTAGHARSDATECAK